MQLLKEIKVGRLALAVVCTLLLADTVPHPGLSAGLLETSLNQVQVNLRGEKQSEPKIAETGIN